MIRGNTEIEVNVKMMDPVVTGAREKSDESRRLNDPRRLSRALYIFAWIVEVIAVTAGLVISVMIGLDAFEQVKKIKGEVVFSDYVNLVAAVIPFLLVAVVEATKIPVAGAAYTAKRLIWKLVFIATLLFLAIITFETMLNGLERNFNNLSYQINTLQKNKVQLEEQLALYQKQKSEADQLSVEWIEEQFNNHRTALVEERNLAREPIKASIAELRAAVKDENVAHLESELNDLREERSSLAQRHREVEADLNQRIDQRVSALSTESTDQRRSIEAAISRDSKRLETLIRDREKTIADTNLFYRSGVDKRLSTEIEKLRGVIESNRNRLAELGGVDSSDSQLASLRRQLSEAKATFSSQDQDLRNRIDAKSREIRLIRGQNESTIKGQLDEANAQLALIENKFIEQQKKNQEQRDARFADFERSEEKAEALDLKIEATGQALADKRNEINEAAGSNQVYRMAMRFTEAESASDVPNETVTWVAAIWFGSLSAVVAFTGILLALASYVVADSGKPKSTVPATKVKPGKLARSLRALVVDRRKRAREPKIKKVVIEKEVPKEVIKEIPVERVAIKEVPKEILVKEIVHVPMFTSDESLIYPPKDTKNPKSKVAA